MTNPNSPTSFEKKLREELYKLQVFRTVPREHTNWWYKQNRIVEAISKLHEEEVKRARVNELQIFMKKFKIYNQEVTTVPTSYIYKRTKKLDEL